jgi:heptosyltransferase-2
LNRHQPKSDRIKRVVVRGVNWVGDAVMTVPALRELRRILPEAHITLATRSWSTGIFADADFIDDILPIDQQGNRLWNVARQSASLARGRFDLAVIFQNAFEAALLTWIARIPFRFGYATDGRRVLLNLPLEVPGWRRERHEVFYYLNIAAELEKSLHGKTSVFQRPPLTALNVSHERRRNARRLLSQHGLDATSRVFALCPGSTNSRAKRWPAERFAALGDMLARETGASVVLIGSKDEQEVSTEVAARMSFPATVLTGQTTLDDAVAVLAEAEAVITNDTGPAHIAAALGRPTAVIFGPTNPETTRPFSENSIVIRNPPDCAPCMLRDCPIDHRCMTSIEPREVFRQIMLLRNETLSKGERTRVSE